MPDIADALEVTRSVRIPRHELHVTFGPSGGPGGQHANRSNTRVELRFDIESSSAFGPVQRRRLLERLGPEIRIVADDERSQRRNRSIAEARLAERIREGLRVERPRTPTRPTAAARERRLAEKQRRADVKRARRRPGPDD